GVVAAVAARVATGVEERERARAGVSGEIGAQPLLLCGPGLAAADLRAVRVERDEVPGTDVEAVPTLTGRSGGESEVLEVPARAGRAVVVVPCGGARDRLHASPCRVVGREVVRVGATVVLVVAEREHRGQPVVH